MQNKTTSFSLIYQYSWVKITVRTQDSFTDLPGCYVQVSRAKKKTLDPVICQSNVSDGETEEWASEGVTISEGEVDTHELDGCESGESGQDKETSDEGGMDTDDSEFSMIGSKRREISPDNDENEAADFGDADASGTPGSGEVKKARICGLYKPPTHNELQTLKETQNIFKSNLMWLQVLYVYTSCMNENLTPTLCVAMVICIWYKEWVP